MSASITISIKSNVKPYFLRDDNLKDFGTKVNQSGSFKFPVQLLPWGWDIISYHSKIA